MKRLPGLLLFLLSASVFAQVGPISITSSQCAQISTASQATVAMSVSGTWTGTLQPEGSIQGQTPFNIQIAPSTATTLQNTIVANGAYVGAVAGYSTFLLCGNTVASGTATVYLQVSTSQLGSTIGGGGGGGGGGGNIVPAVIASGLMAEYRITTGSGTTLVDTSGNNNNATFPGGANNPTWIANTGGLSFLGSSAQYVPLPSALNTAQTITIVAGLPAMPPNASFPGLLISSASQVGLWDSNYDSFNQNTPVVAAWDGTTGNSGINFQVTPLGTHVITWVLDATTDLLYLDNNPASSLAGLHTQGRQSSGVWWLGGGNAPLGGARGTNAYTGPIYYVLFYNRELTPGEVESNYAAIQFAMIARAIPIPTSYPAPDDFVFIQGDSECGQYITTAQLNLNSSRSWHSICVPGSSTTTALGRQPANDYSLVPTNGRALGLIWNGTNDPGVAIPGATTFAQQAAECRNLRVRGIKCGLVSMMSRTGIDTNKNAQNLLTRTNWPSMADFYVDMGSDLHMGCDGCSANTTYFLGDATHPTAYASSNIEAPMISRAVNRFYGNQSWATATTYTATAASTAVTAATQSGNTATYTFASNPFLKGQMVTFTGITPAGYNDTCQALTSTATQITCYLSVTGLGAGSVFGAGITSLQQDADVYFILGGSAITQNATLQTCSGYTGQNIYIKHTNTTSPWTVTPFIPAETIDLAASITLPTASSGHFPVCVFQSTLISPAAAGCTWKLMNCN